MLKDINKQYPTGYDIWLSAKDEYSVVETIDEVVTALFNSVDQGSCNTHWLKAVDPYFMGVWNGFKDFEYRQVWDYRQNSKGESERYKERDIKVGDFLVLRHWNDKEEQYYPGCIIHQVKYVLEDVPELNLHPDYAIICFEQRMKRRCVVKIS